LDPPLTYEEIFNRPDKKKNLWIEARNKELKNMKEKEKFFEIVNKMPKKKKKKKKKKKFN